MLEILKSFFESANERLKNPFIGTFIIAWIVFNWKSILYIIYSDSSIEDKIVLINTEYSSVSSVLLFPLGLAIFYVLLLPYIMWVFDALSSKAMVGRKKQLYYHLGNELDNKTQIAEKQFILEDTKANYKDKAALNDKIEALEEKLTENDKYINRLKNEIKTEKETSRDWKERWDSLNAVSIKIWDVKGNQRGTYDRQFETFRNSKHFSKFSKLGLSVIFQRTILEDEVDASTIQAYKDEGIIIEQTIDDQGKFYYYFKQKGFYYWNAYIRETLRSNDESSI